jgi:hypothetical protein
MTPISINDLAICFERIKFSEAARTQDRVAISHPRYLVDNHRIGIVFIKLSLGNGLTVWQLESDIKILGEYPDVKFT